MLACDVQIALDIMQRVMMWIGFVCATDFDL